MASSSPNPIRRVCVFGGASPGSDEIFVKEAEKLGALLAQQHVLTSYGGGHLGVMGAVATAAHLGGARVQGIVPSCYIHFCGPTLGKEVEVLNIPERLSLMYYSADAFIALPGGVGTLEEIFCMASRSTLLPNKKPIGLLNTKGFFDGLLSFLDNTVEEGFMSPEVRNLIVSAPTVEGLLEELYTYMARVKIVVPVDGKTDVGTSNVDRV